MAAGSKVWILRPLEQWDRELEYQSGYGCMFAEFVLCCVEDRDLAMGRHPVLAVSMSKNPKSGKREAFIRTGQL